MTSSLVSQQKLSAPLPHHCPSLPHGTTELHNLFYLYNYIIAMKPVVKRLLWLPRLATSAHCKSRQEENRRKERKGATHAHGDTFSDCQSACGYTRVWWQMSFGWLCPILKEFVDTHKVGDTTLWQQTTAGRACACVSSKLWSRAAHATA